MQPATPCLVVDVDRVEENFQAMLRDALPLAQIYYAVKANPAHAVLERLVGLGSRFDAASFEEIEACLSAGARAGAISFGNTIKKASAIRRAHEAGVSMFAFDSAEELEKLARITRPAAASIAASWSRTRAPTGRSPASSAPPSKAPAP